MVTPEEKKKIAKIMEEHDVLLRSLNGGIKKVVKQRESAESTFSDFESLRVDRFQLLDALDSDCVIPA